MCKLTTGYEAIIGLIPSEKSAVSKRKQVLRGGAQGEGHTSAAERQREARGGDQAVPVYMRVRHAFPKASNPLEYAVFAEFAYNRA